MDLTAAPFAHLKAAFLSFGEAANLIQKVQQAVNRFPACL